MLSIFQLEFLVYKMSLLENDILFLVAIVVAAPASLLIFYSAFFPSDRRSRFSLQNAPAIKILLQDSVVVDETDGARRILQTERGVVADWGRLLSAFSARFPSLPLDYESAVNHSPMIVPACLPHDTARLELERAGYGLRISLMQKSDSNCVVLHHEAIQDQISLQNLTRSISKAPFAVWMINSSNDIVWNNPEYGRLRNTYMSEEDVNNDRPLFDIHQPTIEQHGSQRFSCADNTGSGEVWFDISMNRSNGHRTFYATDVTALVIAERAQTNFVQTLTKTFAQLGTGLAIFNRDRELILFNPAIVEQTNLSANFLGARPSLSAFFDRLRESRFMPEPRNYAEWRQKLKDLSQEATEGTFSELWSLPSGLSYRVYGRPHPDGAIAFLFEDVTAELSLTRNFIKELEINHALLDRLEQAVAVFSSDGILLYVNKSYRALWGVSDDNSVAPTSLDDAITSWEASTQSEKVWKPVADMLRNKSSSESVHRIVSPEAGMSLRVTAGRLTKGASYAMFSVMTLPSGQENPQEAGQNA